MPKDVKKTMAKAVKEGKPPKEYKIKVSGWAAAYIEKTAKQKFHQTPEKYISDMVSDHVWEMMRKEPEEEED